MPKQESIKKRFQRGLRTGTPANITHTIAIHSGKGGVGKTFVAVNLALALAKAGHKVGLLDADIDCPNVVRSLQLEGKLMANKDRKIVPLEQHGVKIVSVAPMLENEAESLLWRGVRTSRAVEQLVHDTDWGALDYLIVDTPPGTSDVPLSVLQILDSAQLLIVTTPQELALLDAERSAHMAKRLKIPVMGLLENMAGPVFGHGGGEQLAHKLHIPFLGSIPLDASFAGDVRASLHHESLEQTLTQPFRK